MSTLAYALISTKRDLAPERQSTGQAPPGVGIYVDALLGLVPAETLTLHGIILTATTQTVDGKTEINEPTTLYWAFFALLLVSVTAYIVPRFAAKKLEKLDIFRVLIPPLAFVGWTMLQRVSAFDAIFPNLGDANRTVIAVIGTFVLGVAATLLAYKADQNPG